LQITYQASNSKTYASENAYRSHINSKRHKENELKPLPPAPAVSANTVENIPPKMTSLTIAEDASDDEIERTIDEKIAAARSKLSASHCLFCAVESADLENNLTHMASVHSFFIPDADYLVDVTGLISYLGEKIAVGNVCIYCNGKGREFRTLDAVRKHMLDKSHCKIAYDLEADRLEISDYYDFTASYPDADTRQASRLGQTDAWVDVEDEEEVDGDDASGEEVVDEDSDGDSDSLPDNEITYGDSHLELVLPSGARIGHRSMRRYYAQSFPRGGKAEDPNSGAALVRRLLADKNSALVPRKGGFGAFGAGTEVVKARNRGEAREAGRHVREFRDQKRREDFKTKVGFIGNHQKHFRDPRTSCLFTSIKSPGLMHLVVLQ
jgi:pre-60S factor REI1